MPRVPRATKSSPLTFIPPLKPTLSAKPPEGEQWLHEVKHDGFRTQLIIKNGVITAYTSKGLNWTNRYPDLVAEAARLRCRTAIIDGEAVVQREDGTTDFHAFRRALSAEPHRVVYFAFGLMHLDGQDLRKLRLIKRREKLEQLLGMPHPLSAIHFSEAVGGSGAKVFAAAEELGLEGMTMKQNDDFVDATIDAMMEAQRASLTARVGLAEYAYLRGRGIQPKVMYSRALGYRVYDPYAMHRPLNADNAKATPRSAAGHLLEPSDTRPLQSSLTRAGEALGVGLSVLQR